MNAQTSLALLGVILFGCSGESDPYVSTQVPVSSSAGARHRDAGSAPATSASGDPSTAHGTSSRDASQQTTAPPATVGGDSNDDDCSGAAKLVYVLDESGKLSSFHPDTLSFVDIGQLQCDPVSKPYSMSVDRQGVAWVVYESGQLYHVSTSDASCTPIDSPIGAGGFSKFGMGFVALDGRADNDTLFIAGPRTVDISLDLVSALGVIDPTSLSITRVGSLDGVSPELSGTGDGKLWAFYAQDTPPRLNRLDPKTATTLETHTLQSLGGGGATAWAMAFWGGDFWLFLRTSGAASTTVYQVDGKTFEQHAVIPDTGRGIVGAGVSTCAPLEVLL